MATPSRELEKGTETLNSGPFPQGKKTVPTPDEDRASTDAEDSDDESEGEDDPRWTSIRRRRAQSLDSTKKNLKNKKLRYLKPDISTLSKEQERTVKAATNLLTKEQKDNVRRRQDKVTTQREENNPPGPEPGSSSSREKGKTVDPREWGNAGIEPEELDINTQEAMIKEYERGRKEAKKSTQKLNEEKTTSGNEGTSQVATVHKHRSIALPVVNNTPILETQRAGSRPAAQLVPESSLGVALERVARMVGDPDDPDELEPSDGTSSEYESSNYSHSTGSRGSSKSRRRRRHGSKRHSKKKRRRHTSRRRSKSSTSIKPIPPKDYDGAADSRAYHRFVMEGEAYLRDGKVARERQIRILAHHLDGKAYSFYMQKVATDDPNNWNLHKFFTELFNFCFPVDYRQRMRLKLEGLYQKQNQTVSEFVFDLQELFSMVGAMPEEMKVVKLWYSLNTRTQRAMWRDGLHPDSSTWDEVVAKAEVIEIADNVINRRDESKSQGQKGWRSNNFDNNKRPSNPA
jgi:hypothetical protein